MTLPGLEKKYVIVVGPGEMSKQGDTTAACLFMCSLRHKPFENVHRIFRSCDDPDAFDSP